MLERMKKLPAYILVVAMMVMSIASTAHADCAEGFVCDGLQQTSVMDKHDQDDGSQKADCDCCARCAGHHHHAAFTNGKSEPVMVSSQTAHSSEGVTYLSQLHYPPSRPPQA